MQTKQLEQSLSFFKKVWAWFKALHPLEKVWLFIHTCLQIWTIIGAVIYIDEIADCGSTTRWKESVTLLAFLALGTPFPYKIPPFRILAKQPWRDNHLEFFIFYGQGLLGTFNSTYLREMLQSDKFPACFDDAPGYPWYIFLFTAIVTMFVSIMFGIFSLVAILQNVFLFFRHRKIRKNKSIIASMQEINTENAEELLSYFDDEIRHARFSKQSFENMSTELGIFNKGDKPMYIGIQKEEKRDIFKNMINEVKTLKDKFRFKVKKELNYSIPADEKSQQAYQLLQALYTCTPEMLNDGASTAIINYYYNKLNSMMTFTKSFNLLNAIAILAEITAHEQRIKEFEYFFLLAISMSLSFELITISNSFFIYLSDIEHFFDLIFQIMGIFFFARVQDAKTHNDVDSENLVSPLLLFAMIKLAYSLDFIPQVQEVLLFLDRAIKDSAGLFIITLAFLFGFSLSYSLILKDIPIDGGSDTYNLSESVSFVIDQAIGGYTILPTKTVGTPVQYFAAILISLILLNTIIAILSEAWVHVREFKRGYQNKKNLSNLLTLMNYQLETRMKSTSKKTIMIEWFEDPPLDDADYYERNLDYQKNGNKNNLSVSHRGGGLGGLDLFDKPKMTSDDKFKLLQNQFDALNNTWKDYKEEVQSTKANSEQIGNYNLDEVKSNPSDLANNPLLMAFKK